MPYLPHVRRARAKQALERNRIDWLLLQMIRVRETILFHRSLCLVCEEARRDKRALPHEVLTSDECLRSFAGEVQRTIYELHRAGWTNFRGLKVRLRQIALSLAADPIDLDHFSVLLQETFLEYRRIERTLTRR